MTENNMTDLPEDDDEDTVGVPPVNGREQIRPPAPPPDSEPDR